MAARWSAHDWAADCRPPSTCSSGTGWARRRPRRPLGVDPGRQVRGVQGLHGPEVRGRRRRRPAGGQRSGRAPGRRRPAECEGDEQPRLRTAQTDWCAPGVQPRPSRGGAAQSRRPAPRPNHPCAVSCTTVSCPSRFAAESLRTTARDSTWPLCHLIYRHVGPKTVAGIDDKSATTGACPCPCPPRSPAPSPRWPSRSPTGAAGVRTTSSAPSTSSTRPHACVAWPRSSTAPPSTSGSRCPRPRASRWGSSRAG